jgi:hypothetical protein
MRTIICTLRLPDGSSVSGTVSVDTPQAEAAVVYSGDVGRLPTRFSESDIPTLKALFGNAARDLGGSLHCDESGNYDSWAL